MDPLKRARPRGAKLICTLGPATSTAEAVRSLVDAGMDIARINFSHGTEDEHRHLLSLVRRAAEEAGRVVGALADLSGPKVRLGPLRDGGIHLGTGRPFVLRPSSGTERDGPAAAGEVPEGDERGAGTTHPRLEEDLRPGDRVLLADGAVELVVREVSSGEVRTEVTRASAGGRVTSRAGVSIPGERLSLPAITDRDRRDLRRALDLGFDLVAQSFVRSGDDVEALRDLMGERRIPIMAKVENGLAVRAAEDIVRRADVVMVARGDLGVEIPMEEVPVVQKELVRECRRVGTPSAVATQMLESMLGAPRPTRAEVSDVANAVLDGTDAVLLSGETAIGAYPVEAASTAVRIIEAAERRGEDLRLPSPVAPATDEGRAIARGAMVVSRQELRVDAVACFTRSGRTARLIAAERPLVPVFAFSPDVGVVRSLAAVWGVRPLPSETPSNVDALIAMIDERLVGNGLLAKGATVVLVAAAPVGRSPTNLLKVHRLGTPGYAR